MQTIGIFVNGGFAERVSIPMAMAYRTVFPLPENMSYEVGATLEPLSVALYGVHRAEPAPGDTVVIQGAGPIGLCALQSFKAMGLSKIIVIGGKRKKRLALAKAMGADIVISAEEEDPVKRVYEAKSGKGADIVAETAGAPPTMRRAIDMACFKGKIIVYTLSAWPDPKWTVDDIFLKQLTLIGTQGGGALEPLELVQAGKVNTKSLITHEFPLDRIKEAFETALTNDEAVKVMVKL